MPETQSLPAPQEKKSAKTVPEEAHAAAAAAFLRDREAEHDRLVAMLRRRGFFTHAELVELLGAGDVEVEHHEVVEGRGLGDDAETAGRLAPARTPKRDEDGALVTQENGAPVMVKAGTRSVAHDSHTARAFVDAVLGLD